MMNTENVLTQVLNPDSIELGTPKTGKVKIYFDASNQADAEIRLISAIKIMKLGKKIIEEEDGGNNTGTN